MLISREVTKHFKECFNFFRRRDFLQEWVKEWVFGIVVKMLAETILYWSAWVWYCSSQFQFSANAHCGRQQLMVTQLNWSLPPTWETWIQPHGCCGHLESEREKWMGDSLSLSLKWQTIWEAGNWQYSAWRFLTAKCCQRILNPKALENFKGCGP